MHSSTYSIENDCWCVEYTPHSGNLNILDKNGGSSYSSESPFLFIYGNFYRFQLHKHCRCQIETKANEMFISFTNMDFWARFPENPYRKPVKAPLLEFNFSMHFEGDDLVFTCGEIANMDDEDCSISFPHGLCGILSSDEGEVVIPSGYGSYCPLPENGSIRMDYRYCSHPAITLPLCGLMCATHGGIGLYCRTPFDAVWTVDINHERKNRAGIGISFDYNRDYSNYSREILMHGFRPGENYQALAKWYRRHVVTEGRFKSLNKKIAEHPEVEKLVGAVIWKHSVSSRKDYSGEHTFSMYMPSCGHNKYEGKPSDWSAYDIFNQAYATGFDRLCIYNTNWLTGGYDSMLPSRFPLNDFCGTEEEFRAAADYGRTLSEGYVYSVHDNYYDCYRNSSEFPLDSICTDEYGSPVNGGIWRGGRASLICGRFRKEYALRDMPRIASMTGRGSIYIDVLGCFPFQECRNSKHPQSRREDAASRRCLFTMAKTYFGSVASEMAPSDYCVDLVDAGCFGSLYFCGELPAGLDNFPIPIPLWQLIFHDSVLNYTSEGAFGFWGEEYVSFMALYGMLPTAIDQVNLTISRQLRDAYKEEMLSHEFISRPQVIRDNDGTLHLHAECRTRFADGTTVTALLDKQNSTFKIER